MAGHFMADKGRPIDDKSVTGPIYDESRLSKNAIDALQTMTPTEKALLIETMQEMDDVYGQRQDRKWTHDLLRRAEIEAIPEASRTPEQIKFIQDFDNSILNAQDNLGHSYPSWKKHIEAQTKQVTEELLELGFDKRYLSTVMEQQDKAKNLLNKNAKDITARDRSEIANIERDFKATIFAKLERDKLKNVRKLIKKNPAYRGRTDAEIEALARAQLDLEAEAKKDLMVYADEKELSSLKEYHDLRAKDPTTLTDEERSKLNKIEKSVLPKIKHKMKKTNPSLSPADLDNKVQGMIDWCPEFKEGKKNPLTQNLENVDSTAEKMDRVFYAENQARKEAKKLEEKERERIEEEKRKKKEEKARNNTAVQAAIAATTTEFQRVCPEFMRDHSAEAAKLIRSLFERKADPTKPITDEKSIKKFVEIRMVKIKTDSALSKIKSADKEFYNNKKPAKIKTALQAYFKAEGKNKDVATMTPEELKQAVNKYGKTAERTAK